MYVGVMRSTVGSVEVRVGLSGPTLLVSSAVEE
jgi:hypothetical protein